MSYPWCPRFVVGDLDYTFTLPMRPPTPVKGGVGGSETAAAGLPASYTVRRDYMIDVVLRFWEEDWPDVEELIDAMQTHLDSTAFYADTDQDDPDNTCYLESPAMGSEWQPTRSDDLAGGKGYELTIRLRSITGLFNIEYFVDVLES